MEKSAVKMIGIIVLISMFSGVLSGNCMTRGYPDGYVCVCDSMYCDTVPDLEVSSENYQIYYTRKDWPGFYSKTGPLSSETEEGVVTVRVDRTIKYQTIIGFGGAFTDSTGINIDLLPKEAQEKLLETYFSESGIQYSLCRVPIGGTDFSTRGYSYDDIDGDVTLEHFELQPDDYNYKIPYIQRAIELNRELKLFASPWTAPAWMKTNDGWAGFGVLKKEHYQLWADYIVKFFNEYDKHNITYWGMTLQNEFINGFVPDFFSKINAMGWVPSQLNKWIEQNIGPAIRNSSHRDLKIMLFDDNRETIPLLIPTLEDEGAMKYADGVAIHWYWNDKFPITTLDVIKSYMKKYNMFLLPSEACNGSTDEDRGVRKGSWERGLKYFDDIVENIQYGASGWVDWNLVLDEGGGPTYIDNFVDAPIIVNTTLEEFYKQPTFYALGHFSKFARPESVRVESSISNKTGVLKAVAFLRPDNLTAVVLSNTGDSKVKIQIVTDNSQTSVVEIDENSINTILLQ